MCRGETSVGRPLCGGWYAKVGGKKKIWSDCGVKLTDVKGLSLTLFLVCESENEIRVKRVLGF